MFKDGLIILCSVLILLIVQHCSIMEKNKKDLRKATKEIDVLLQIL